jgi:predicted 3-demethylubiquinone-9 3-methyltransferase (glyoxalase superfamily)
MQKITPFLWFNHQAEEAVTFYTSIFQNAKMGSIMRYSPEAAKASGMPVGSVMTVDFELCGQQFAALDGGPVFQFTPAVSLFVNCETEEQIDALWGKLSEGGGKVLFEFGKYAFAEKYGWLNDKYGVSWQLMLNDKKQSIAPALLFVGERYGKAEEAINYYMSVFDDSKLSFISRREKDMEGEIKGTVEYASFQLEGQDFVAMEGKKGHTFDFTSAISFVVNCQTQEEVDAFWDKLSADPNGGQCGWCTDKFGVSWQVVPTILTKYLGDKDPEKSRRVMQAMLQMKKIDIAALEKAYKGGAA